MAAAWPDDSDAVRRLFRSYADWLQEDLSYQNFDAELAGLPGFYATPQGAVLLLRSTAGEALGCVGLRPMGGGACELKRLWVEASLRGGGWGRRLTESAIVWARRAGYRRILLDSLPRLEAAVRLYRDLGFVTVPPYYDNPQEDILYFGLDLEPAPSLPNPETRIG
ncbi:GNAT family N-acetyltransferase [Algihabitans albus]|uniref:GNAT family N-acetyltransferase n=1 Tax=Algihabitans albus TaxID=2164067 RepID=UPI001ABC3844|nr:GNAT family N-acetyltransferase [Algihabitans albus]